MDAQSWRGESQQQSDDESTQQMTPQSDGSVRDVRDARPYQTKRSLFDQINPRTPEEYEEQSPTTKAYFYRDRTQADSDAEAEHERLPPPRPAFRGLLHPPSLLRSAAAAGSPPRLLARDDWDRPGSLYRIPLFQTPFEELRVTELHTTRNEVVFGVRWQAVPREEADVFRSRRAGTMPPLFEELALHVRCVGTRAGLLDTHYDQAAGDIALSMAIAHSGLVLPSIAGTLHDWGKCAQPDLLTALFAAVRHPNIGYVPVAEAMQRIAAVLNDGTHWFLALRSRPMFQAAQKVFDALEHAAEDRRRVALQIVAHGLCQLHMLARVLPNLDFQGVRPLFGMQTSPGSRSIRYVLHPHDCDADESLTLVVPDPGFLPVLANLHMIGNASIELRGGAKQPVPGRPPPSPVRGGSFAALSTLVTSANDLIGGDYGPHGISDLVSRVQDVFARTTHAKSTCMLYLRFLRENKDIFQAFFDAGAGPSGPAELLAADDANPSRLDPVEARVQ